MACIIGDVVALLEELAPPNLAEDWDNAGLQVGSARAGIDAVLVTLDVTPAVLQEARERGAGLIVCHHPPVFRPLRRLVTDEPQAALLRDALVAGLAVYAAHTSLDASPWGVNAALGGLFGLENGRPLLPAAVYGCKLVTFVPPEHAAAVSAALFAAGAGVIGGYSGCSFRVKGTGTFKPGPGTHPAYGDATGPNGVEEVRLEVALAAERVDAVVESLLANHPYEEPAYDLYRTHNPSESGMGRIGDLSSPVTLRELAGKCSALLGCPQPRVAGDGAAVISRLAVCGGSGGELAMPALQAGAQAFITGEVSHHQALEAASAGLAIIDAGHYHTERPVVPHLVSLLAQRARAGGLEVEILASEVQSDPWSDGGDG